MRKMCDPLLGTPAFGDVFVGRDPPAIRQRLVHNLYRTPVGGLDDADSSMPDLAQYAVTIFVGVAHERSGGLSMSDHLAERAARFQYLPRQSIHLDVAPVADDQPLR